MRLPLSSVVVQAGWHGMMVETFSYTQFFYVILLPLQSLLYFYLDYAKIINFHSYRKLTHTLAVYGLVSQNNIYYLFLPQFTILTFHQYKRIG